MDGVRLARFTGVVGGPALTADGRHLALALPGLGASPRVIVTTPDTQIVTKDEYAQRARALKRDPQLESLMRSRSKELGIEAHSRLDRVIREPNIERAISHGIRRDRGLGMSM